MRTPLRRALRSFGREGGRPLLAMALPIIAEQAFITLLGLVNAGMAGKAGTDVASAVGLVNSITNLMTALFAAIALGGTVAVSRARGAEDPAAADRAAFQCLRLSLFFSLAAAAVLVPLSRPAVELLFGASSAPVRSHAAVYLGWTAAGYPFLALTLAASGVLRGAGDARTPMGVNMVMNLVSAAAGWLLIFGRAGIPALGAAGAGMAVGAARVAGTVLYAAVLVRGAASLDLFRRGRGSGASGAAGVAEPWSADLAVAGRAAGLQAKSASAAVLAVGIPAAVESLAFNGGKLLTQTYVAALGPAAAAADYLASAVSSLMLVPISSLQLAVPPLVGAALGRRRPDDARAVVGLAVLWGSAVTAVLVLPGGIFAEALLGLSTDDGEVLALGTGVFRLFCALAPLFWAASFVVPAGLRGAGDGRYTMIISVVSMWALRVGLGYLLAVPAGLGLLGVWIAMGADWICRSLLFLPRLKGGVWVSRH